MSSAAVDAMKRYSALALGRDTVDCFLALQEMQLLPRNVQNPVVDHQLIEQPAQLASENPYKSRVLEAKICNPK